MADDAQPAVPDDVPPSMPDVGSLLDMAMGLQQQMAEAQQQAAEVIIEGQSGGGVVRIEVTGGLEFRSVTIDPAAVDPDDVEMLQDLVLAALHDALARVGDLVAEANPLGGLDLGALDLGAIDLSALAGMFGGESLIVEEGLEIVEIDVVDTDALEFDPRQIDAIATDDGDDDGDDARPTGPTAG